MYMGTKTEEADTKLINACLEKIRLEMTKQFYQINSSFLISPNLDMSFKFAVPTNEPLRKFDI